MTKKAKVFGTLIWIKRYYNLTIFESSSLSNSRYYVENLTLFFVIQDKKYLIDLNQKIKVAAGVINPNPNYIIELLDEVYRFPVDPRILKENLDIVHTVKAIRGYVGPVSHAPGISPLQGEELNARVR